MAHPDPDESSDSSVDGERGVRRSPADRVLDGLRTVTFWLAVFLPLAVGGLVIPDLESAAQWRLFVVLATASVVALYLGHSRVGR